MRSLLRAVGSVIVFVTSYYLLPLDTSVTWAAIIILVSGLTVLIVLVAYSIRAILRSPFPGLRAIEALAVTVPLFLLLFASAYVVMDRISRASFTQPLTHTDALYFTVTVFTTVGFGDIAARTQAARLVVTFQMVADVLIIGIAIRAIVSAARHGRQRGQSAGPLVLCADHAPARGSRAGSGPLIPLLIPRHIQRDEAGSETSWSISSNIRMPIERILEGRARCGHEDHWLTSTGGLVRHWPWTFLWRGH